MSNLKKAGSLILSNVGMFNEAHLLLTKIDEEIFEEIDKIIEEWAISNGWEGNFEWSGDGLWTYPPIFAKKDEEGEEGEEREPFAYFSFFRRDDSASNSFWIADLCKQGQTDFGFRFVAEHNLFGGKTKWNAYCRNLSESASQLPMIGFVDEGKGSWFLPIQIDKNALASGYENDAYDKVFEPITQALDKIKSCVQIFDEVIESGKKACF
jgi:hypothetical protein